MYSGSIIPPSLPTSLAFFLLSLVLIETSGRLIWENSKTQVAATSMASAAFLMVFILLAAGILTGGYFAYRSFEQNYRTEVENQLASIAQLKEEQLVQWRTERLGDGQVFYKNKEFTALVRQYVRNQNDHETKTSILNWVSQVQAIYGYDFMMLLDGKFNTRMAFPENKERIRLVIDQKNVEKMMLGEISFQDFYRNEQDQRIYLKILVPILDDRSPNRLIAVLALRIDPEQYLYPFIQSWPVPSKSAETLLIRREGNAALYLNELRHQSGAALTLRIPLDKVETPAVRAVLGQTGLVQGGDYRDVPVIAFVRAIAGSPWYLVAKIDVAEAFAPLRDRLWLTMVLICALLLASGSGVGFAWRLQRSRFYEKQYESAEALVISELRYRRLFESAKDGILILDPETGTVVDVNPFLVQILDLPVEALLGRKIWELGFFKDIVANQDKFLELREEGCVRYDDLPMETADGRRIDVEFVSNVYEAGLSKVIQCNIRDITERKQAEEMARNNHTLHELRVHQIELEQQNEELRRTQKELETSRARYFDFYDLAPVGYITVSEKELILEANLTTATLLDVDRSALINQPITRFILKEDSDSYYLHRKKLNVNGEPQAFDLRMLKLGGAEFWVQLVTTVAQTVERAPVCRVVMSDITERKRAEQALHKSEQTYRSLVNAIPDTSISLFDKDMRYQIIGGSEFEKNNIDKSQIEGRTLYEVYPKDIVVMFEPLYKKALNDEPTAFEMPLGEYIYSQQVLPVKDEKGNIFGAMTISTNITERKRAEEELRENQEKFSTAFQTSPSAITITRAKDGKFIEVNDAFISMAGFTREEVLADTSIGLNLWVNEDDRQQVVAALRAGQTVTGHEYRFRTKNDGIITGMFSARGIMLRSEPCILSSITDISERKQADEEIKKQLDELFRWHNATLGRESRILDLKREVNELLGKAGDPPRYPSAESQDKKKE